MCFRVLVLLSTYYTAVCWVTLQGAGIVLAGKKSQTNDLTSTRIMKNPITDSDQHLSHKALFAKFIPPNPNNLVTVVLTERPHALFEHIEKYYAKVVRVNQSSRLINDRNYLELILNQLMPSATSPSTLAISQTTTRSGCISLQSTKKHIRNV